MVVTAGSSQIPTQGTLQAVPPTSRVRAGWRAHQTVTPMAQ